MSMKTFSGHPMSAICPLTTKLLLIACDDLLVRSYNVLSSHLASPGYFTHCKAANLKSTNRLQKIFTKLDAECSANSVICLQEVSRSWAGKMHVFFEERNYQFVTGLYGHGFNGYMGVALAYPMDSFKGVKIDIDRLADCGNFPQNPDRKKKKAEKTVVGRIFDFAMGFIKAPVKLITGGGGQKGKWDSEDPWAVSEKRSNILISARLEPKAGGKEFLVSTYHMPCAFRTPQIMMIHSALAVKRCRELANGKDENGADLPEIPHALVGDWNFKPSSPMYNLVTTGVLDAETTFVEDWKGQWDLHVPTEKWGVGFEYDKEGMLSAYKEKKGVEVSA